MHAQDLPALGACPLNFLGFQEFSDSRALDEIQVFDHAHSVARSIAFVDVLDLLAGIRGAAEAKLEIACQHLLAVPDPAFNTVSKS
ncbi:MAG: hypothetical protein HGA35_03175 [Erysipelotrichaceae bacterium]|nr:hypothetical protein [Erysipelotrichaceae bacterium]